jgi:putative tryptophan/tyrosine transport system substrate-binding protein
MRRREFIMLLGGAVVTRPIAAPAQQSERMRRIGVLMLYPENDSEGQRRATAFQQGLQKLGGSSAAIFISNGAWATTAGYDLPPRSCCDWHRT